MIRGLRDTILGRTIRGRVGRFLLAAALIPLVGVAGWVVFSQRGVLANSADQNMASHAELEARAVAGVLGQARENIDVLAANPILSSGSELPPQHIREQLQAFTIFEDVTLLDTTGRVVESATYSFTGSWQQNAAFLLAREGQPSISEARLNLDQTKLVVEFGGPVFDGDDVIRVVVGRMNMERVWDTLDSIQVGNAGFMAAFDRHGNLIAYPDRELLLTKLDGFPEFQGLTETTPLEITQPDGVSFVGQVAPVGVLGWSVAGLQDRGEAYALANDTVEKILFATIVAFIFTAFAVTVMSRAIASPIRALGVGMREIAGGNLTLRTAGAGLEEIDDLATSFNAMAKRLEQRSAELEEEVTQRRQVEEQVRHVATHDSLTGLPNRTLLKDRANLALAQARRSGHMVGLAFLDLDRFKLVNDTMGHSIGDQLLKDVAGRLVNFLREGDTIARLGGDEFVILLPDISDVKIVHDVVNRVVASMRRGWQLAGREFHVTASAGVAIFPDDSEDTESLLRNADTAMYRAKDEGRDNFQLYSPAMNTHLAGRVKLEMELRRALEEGEFIVHYQPQVDARNHRLIGVEALIRWQHPERGLIMPANFIPLAEQIGTIRPIGEWVLRTVCVQMRAWLDAGCDDGLRVAVNISALQFQDQDLATVIRKVLDDTGVPARNLDIEITESVAMKDAEHSILVLSRLKAMGVRLSIDDFGTGYSSLSYLKRLPIDAVKIDRSFVRDLGTDPEDAAIVASIISLATSLNLHTVAEGVETEEQLKFLADHRCSAVQGYLFGKPEPAGVSLPGIEWTPISSESPSSSSQPTS